MSKASSASSQGEMFLRNATGLRREVLKHVLKNMDKYSQMWTFIPRFWPLSET